LFYFRKIAILLPIENLLSLEKEKYKIGLYVKLYLRVVVVVVNVEATESATQI
jgi:hypothetical protein